MKVTLILSLVLMVLFFLLLWAAVALVQSKKLFGTAPKDIQATVLEHEERFPGARLLGWVILLTKSRFFQHYYPETEGCEGYHQFGFNRKEQLAKIILFPFAALLLAWICTLF
ncbi:MAG: hypothetical protein NC251_13035 [Lachnoclostridium sp.]|nr:hypothetical protein [Lachnospira sp.]MCM1249339.1 hypothetical protein [Lachnoclostridium sp.]MCM1536435.1 hypothetical protein [Clostridium sp.]